VVPGVVTLCKVGADGAFIVQVGVTGTPTAMQMTGNTCRTIASVNPARQDDVIVTITEPTGPTYRLDRIVMQHGGTAPRTITGTGSVSFEAVHGAIVTYYNDAVMTACKHGTAATLEYQIGHGTAYQSVALAAGECRPIGTLSHTVLAAADDVIVTVREPTSQSYVLDHIVLEHGLAPHQTIVGPTSISFEGGHGAVIRFFNTAVTATGCTYSQGYYKNRGAALLPAGTFHGSGQTYLAVLETSPRGGNAYYILAHQFIAAALNAKSASVPANVRVALNDAQAYFSTAGITPAAPYTSTWTKARLTAMADLLGRYNEGLEGPRHC
jgi:hypothetical protein